VFGVPFCAGDVSVPLVSWRVTPSNSGLLSNIRVTPNALRYIYICDPVQTEHRNINTVYLFCLFCVLIL
jgi:hypothetical protein